MSLFTCLKTVISKQKASLQVHCKTVNQSSAPLYRPLFLIKNLILFPFVFVFMNYFFYFANIFNLRTISLISPTAIFRQATAASL